MKSILVIFVTCIFSLSLIAKETPKIKKIEGFVYVPRGTFESGTSTVSTMSFWMSQCEVTNAQYRLFLSDLKTQNRTADYNKALPDTAAWNLSDAYMEPMTQLYFNHPAYSDYPVVNISIDGANLYCAWLYEKLKSKFGDVVSTVRLPNSTEWTYAATGGLERAVYSWSGPYLRNDEGKFMANFKSIGDENITTIDSTVQLIPNFGANYSLDNAFIVAPADSYSPNNFGLYNMSGNVSELVVKPQQGEVQRASQQIVAIGGNWNSTGYDIRITSEISFEKANPFVGFRPIISLQ